MAFTTDSYVIRPLFFPGGDIGSLAVFGTVNDLAMCGARPLYLSCGFIIEEGFEMETLWRIVQSMQQAAQLTEALAAEQEGNQDAAGPGSSKRKGHGRRPLPPDLPRHRIEYAVDPQELACPCCGQQRIRIGEEVSEQLDYTPASLFVIQHVRPKLACRRCEDITQSSGDTWR